MSILKQLLIILAMVISADSYGQFPGDSLRFHVKMGATGAYMHGNINQIRLAATAQVGYNSPSGKWNLGHTVTYNYLNDKKIIKQSDVMSMFVARYRIHPKLYPIGILWGQTNRLFSYEAMAVGAGYEWVAVKTPRHFVAPSLTCWYEWAHFKSTDFMDGKYDGKSNINTPRLALRLLGSHQFFPVKLRLSYNLYFMQSLQWADNYRIFFNPALEVPVYKGLALKLAYQYTYESVIIVNRVHADHAFTYGITYDFKR